MYICLNVFFESKKAGHAHNPAVAGFGGIWRDLAEFGGIWRDLTGFAGLCVASHL